MPGFGKEKPKLDRASRPPRPPNVTRVGLEGAALRYLERFDCSVARLRKVLTERIAKAARAGVAEAAAAPAIVEELLLRYQSSGLIDDQRFAKNFAARQRDRGMSGRMIEQKLRARGIPAEVVQELLPRGESASVELEAARAFARRRRLGPHRKADVREAYRRKDLMAMARAGFNYDTASRVVGNSSSTDDEF
ncbi:MAG TPA: RecX family transcriptional regulator [Polyangiaceae bacterium]|nr:RecX family transcriptional regulator [Polyangiaceae bacterium]